ncbi:HIRAN domain-containing protein [Paenibacillus thailandensis]|uniref:HIRAN domain-containing protein n=1 Tax=Paenibacillus thailandensis TaxID=393250 RepID=A0ABW5QZE1_9BACL
MNQPIYVAITGTQHYYGAAFIKPGQIIHLTKDPDNIHDHEAIRAEIIPIGKIGYVANSAHTVPNGCWSAGRMYDTFDRHICAIVRFIVKDLVIAELAPDIEEVYILKTTEQTSFDRQHRELSDYWEGLNSD